LGLFTIFLAQSGTTSSIALQAATPAVQKAHQHQSNQPLLCCIPAPPDNSNLLLSWYDLSCLYLSVLVNWANSSEVTSFLKKSLNFCWSS